MVEKGAEFPVGDSRRKWKYHVVFQGNNVKDQNWEFALYHEHACVPARLEASRIADIATQGTASKGVVLDRLIFRQS